ncbi:hypothetical protein D3C77_406080 [compost metagenome]
MDFYLKDVSATRQNVASKKLESLVFKASEARGTISDEVMEWMLATLPNLPLSTHLMHLIAMYLMIARHSVPLPPAFGQAFERYLLYLNIDPSQPLPALNLFPREDSVGAYDLRGLWRMICSIRGNLADMAKVSDNPIIAQAADDIRRMTAATVSNRLVTEG